MKKYYLIFNLLITLGQINQVWASELKNYFSEGVKSYGNPPQKQSTKGVEFSRNKEGDSINDNIKAQ
ncbi:MAG: hypothetical protein RLZZ81_746 [Pseudomonadota bacterium]|jgi:hypothetical protein